MRTGSCHSTTQSTKSKRGEVTNENRPHSALQWATPAEFARQAREKALSDTPEAKALRHHVGYRARRWVVKRSHSWINRYRGLLVRWTKKADNYLAFLHLACGIITWRALSLLGQVQSDAKRTRLTIMLERALCQIKIGDVLFKGLPVNDGCVVCTGAHWPYPQVSTKKRIRK